MRKILILCVSFLLMTQLAYAGKRFTLSGYVKNETSLNYQTHQLTKFKNIVQLGAEYKFNDNFTFFGSARYWYDNVYGWYNKYDSAQDQMAHVQRTDWLRDLYMDYNNGPWFVRLGKQQVAWGQADGIAILDRVNPVDLTEYWLPDAVDIRIPVGMININYSPKTNSNLQLLIIPDFQQSIAAPPGSPFVFRSYKLFGIAKQMLGPNLITNIYYPAMRFETSKFGVQWQDRFRDWEYTLNYLYGYDYLARTYVDQPFIPRRQPGYYSRRFKLVQMAGGSLNHTFTNKGLLEGITLRSDAAVYINEPTYYGNPATGNSAGVARWNNIFWLVGLDRYFFTKLLASFQFAQYILEHDGPGIAGQPTYKPLNTYTYGAQDKMENIFSLKLSANFINDRFKPEILWSFTDDNQGRISPKINYEIIDNLVFSFGVHYFYGDERDSNGEFRKQNQIYTMMKYSF
jgi:hypothetical protein